MGSLNRSSAVKFRLECFNHFFTAAALLLVCGRVLGSRLPQVESANDISLHIERHEESSDQRPHLVHSAIKTTTVANQTE